MIANKEKIPVNGANHSGDREKQNNQYECTQGCITRQEAFVSISRRFLKSFLVWIACWELLPAALVVLLSGGLKND
jgi:hypothetical protein